MAQATAGVVGSGIVGETLANGLLGLGYQVMRGTRDPGKLADWKRAAGDRALVGSPGEAARFGALVILAVKGSGAESTVRDIADALANKTVIDTTNPIADAPPDQGVLRYFTDANESLMERLQALAPGARFVKAFSSVGNALMVNPVLGGVTPTMFICGNDAGAKTEVRELLTRFGWETEDMGAAPAARAIEPLCILWCIPGFLRNEWSHAFKLLKR
jgi:predicted dinucleotide-binding enzyme